MTSIQFAALACALGAATLSGCAGGGGAMGLPMPEFNRVFVAGVDVAGAEHCGRKVDAALVRSNLIASQTKRGLPPDQIQNSGTAFDKVRGEFKQRVATQADFCSKDYKADLSKNALYEKGEFPDVK